jgi:diguanylate cyclase (GGDEF)-like protein/PAS domain S-box-containing protein
MLVHRRLEMLFLDLVDVIIFIVSTVLAFFVFYFFLQNRRLINRAQVSESQLQAIYDNAPVEIYLKNVEGRYISINRQFEQLFEVKNNDIMGLLPTDIHPSPLGVATQAHDQEVLKTLRTVVREEEAITSFGVRHLHTVKFPTFDENNCVTGLGAVVSDITETVLAKKRAERAEKDLSQETERLASVLEMSEIGGWEFDLVSGKLSIDENFAHIVDVDYSEELTIAECFQGLVNSSRKPLSLAIENGISRHEEFDLELEFNRKDGSSSWLRLVGKPVEKDGNVNLFTGFAQNVDEHKQTENSLRVVASTDPLTGLLNRRGLREYLQSLVERDTGILFILAIDLDNFKEINDRLGHDNGDLVLEHCAQVLRKYIHPNGVVARVGGDEFIVVLEGLETKANAHIVAKKLIKYLAENSPKNGLREKINASIGISKWDRSNCISFKDEMVSADIALQFAKRGRKSQIMHFRPSMRAEVLARQSLVDDIVEGVDQGQFEAFFQPQIRISDNSVIGLEALIRWHHPVRGLLKAGDFIDVANENTLIQDLDELVMQAGIDLFTSLSKAGTAVPKISVNVSQTTLMDSTFPSRLLSWLKSKDMPPQALSLEILETVLLKDLSGMVTQNIEKLNASGFGIVLDDFGTNFASLSNLHSLPVDGIKIDRSFVRRIDRDNKLRHLTETIIFMANKLKIGLVAEGLETPMELTVLKELGCDAVQGYLISAAMPEPELRQWLQAGDIGLASNVLDVSGKLHLKNGGA